MLDKLSLRNKLIISMLVIGLVPLLITGFLMLSQVSSTLEDQFMDKLSSIREAKAMEISKYLNDRLADIAILAQSADATQCYLDMKAYHDERGYSTGDKIETDTPEYQAIYNKHHPYFEKYTDQKNYYDVFVICAAHGQVLFSEAREADLGTNLKNGEYSDSSLAVAWQRALDTGTEVFVDFEPYAPSNNEPAAFIAAPIMRNASPIAVVALQLSITDINEMMQERTGMGETGETYLVGSDYKMRSDSYLAPDTHSVKASFANPDQGSVHTEATEKALAGESGTEIIIDYNGNPVLSSYAPLDIQDTRWAIMAEVDEAEAFAALNGITITIVVTILVSGTIVFGMAYLLAGAIGKPIRSIFRGLRSLSSKELNATSSSFLSIIDNLNAGAGQVENASNQIAQTSQELSSGASQQASTQEEISGSVEELTASTSNNADNAREADKLSEEGVMALQALGREISELRESSDEMAKIIKTIDEVAFQTNLLALNAAVEAARAGEAGKGFAVVAEEVRNLARRSAEASRTTSELINAARDKAQRSADASDEMKAVFERINHITHEVAEASDEQAQNLNQVNKAIFELDKVTQSNAASSEEAASASEELNAQSSDLLAIVNSLIKITRGQEKLNISRERQIITGNPNLRPRAGTVRHKQAEALPSRSSQNNEVGDITDF